MGLMDNSTATVANAATASAVTMEQLMEMSRELKALSPPPPNPKECRNCHEPMEYDGHPVYLAASYPGVLPLFGGPPACYLCGRCVILMKRTLPTARRDDGTR